MTYIGNTSPSRFSSVPAVQRFSGNNSTTAFTLSTAIGSEQEILVSVDGVIQDTANYTVSGTTLTFSPAPSAGTNNIFVFTLSRAIASVTHPPTSALSATSGTFSGNVNVGGDLDVTGSLDMSDANLTNVGSISLDSISGDADSNTNITFSGSDVITFTTGGSTAFTANANQSVTFSGSITGTTATLTTTDNSTQLQLISTDADANTAPVLDLFRNSGSPADNDALGRLLFSADNDAGEVEEFGYIQAFANDVSNGSEDGTLFFFTKTAGADVDRFNIAPTESVFNDGSVEVNFRVESNNDANAFFVQGSDGFVGLGTSSPSQLLHLKSTTNAKPNLLIETENAGANGGRLDFLHKSSSPADGDLLGDITFGGYSDDGTPPSDFARYVMIKAYAEDVSNNNEKGRLTFSIHSGASNENNVDVLTLNGDKTGIGTTTPARQLTVENTLGNSGGELGILSSDSSTTGTFGTIHFGNNTDTSLASIRAKADGSTSAGKLEFNTEADGGAIETRMTIDGNGNVGVATGASLTAAQFNVELAGVAITGDTDGATMEDSGIVQLYNSNNGTTNSTVMLLGGTSLGVPAQIASGIGFTRENSSNWGTQLRFYTHETATSDVDALRERIRIDSAGNTMFGCTAFGEDGLSVGIRYSNSNTTTQLRWNRANDSGAGGALVFMNAGTQVGTVTYTSGSTSYTTSSDYRLKENLEYSFDATARLKQLKPCRFNFKTDADTTVDGFLAHEVSSIVPEAITGEKDAMTEEVLYVEGDEIPDGKKIGDVKEASKIDPQSIDQSKLVPLLTKTLQEALTRIDTLEAEVKVLKG